MALGFHFTQAFFGGPHFKSVPDGWLFEAASPWCFGQSRTYLVTDAQRSAITDQLRRSRSICLIMIFSVLPLMIAAYVKHAWSVEVGAMFGAWAIFYAFSTMIDFIEYLIVGRLLHGAPRTTQLMSCADKRQVLSEAVTVRTLAVYTAILSFGAALNIYIFAVATKPAFAHLAAACGAGLAVLVFSYGTMLVAKLRAKPMAAIGSKAL